MNTDPLIQTQIPRSNGTAQKPRRWQLSVKSAGLTDPGREREGNEDQFLIATLTRTLRIQQSSLPDTHPKLPDEQGHLFVVADGMGGAIGGKQASALAVTAIEEFMIDALRWLAALRAPAENQVLNEFRSALNRADARLFEEVAKHPELEGMGTTLTMAYSFGGELFIAHVGDSRCYLLRKGKLHQLTNDHTVVQELVRQGILPPERAQSHELRHVITNVVGGERPGIQVELHKVMSAPGDVVLLCSDGLTEMLQDDAITAILSTSPEPTVACDRLVSRANELGGRDNVTVVVARFDVPE